MLASTEIENPASASGALETTMLRVGARMIPAEFVRRVAEIYQEIQQGDGASEAELQFARGRPRHDLLEALRQAKLRLHPPITAVALGCGTGFAGRPAQYAATAVREVFAPTELAELRLLDLSPVLLNKSHDWSGRPADLLVSHSLLHFIPLSDFRPFFDLLKNALAAGGAWIMAHEPNRRYWANPECQTLSREWLKFRRKRDSIRKYFISARYLARCRRMLGGAEPASVESQVNRVLRTRFHCSAELSVKEIRRIVDPHLPDGLSGQFAFGLEGFDVLELQGQFLPRLRPAWIRSSVWLGAENPAELPRRWRALEDSLAARFAMDGRCLTVLWEGTGAE